ncbi:MAG: nitrate reductase molybdenum cofactor assembly chaperone [Deltaproteobacteria bacterium]|nr:nitrate reductase molybdenum cofactor assembly chaperone [Deltaproteobacteria bacterium]MBW2070631.1 nitrate reductase molybdenum cofactor assembly chaperone [Deltaproteobacteria bacterium]
MTTERRLLLKILSILLSYPDDQLLCGLPELEKAVGEIADSAVREECLRFLVYVSNTALLRLQEEYTATFDLNPATCLNLTYHKWGDDRERGRALIEFLELYERSGYEKSSGELADYLPIILEFLSICPEDQYHWQPEAYHLQLKEIGSCLRQLASPYAGLLRIVAAIFADLEDKGE